MTCLKKPQAGNGLFSLMFIIFKIAKLLLQASSNQPDVLMWIVSTLNLYKVMQQKKVPKIWDFSAILFHFTITGGNLLNGRLELVNTDKYYIGGWYRESALSFGRGLYTGASFVWERTGYRQRCLYRQFPCVGKGGPDVMMHTGSGGCRQVSFFAPFR